MIAQHYKIFLCIQISFPSNNKIQYYKLQHTNPHIKNMKKWKILNDSDKQSQNSTKQKLEPNTPKPENKTHRYVPLKRSKDLTILNNSRNIQSSRELYLPIFSQCYVKYDSNVSVGSGRSKDKDRDKFKTECYGDQELEFQGKNFQDIQQNFKKNMGGLRFSDRSGGSLVLKRKQEDTIISQRQTERKFFKESSFNKQTDQFQKYKQNFKRKHEQKQGGLKNLRQTLQTLSNKQRSLAQEIKVQLGNFSILMKQNGAKISQKISEGEKCPKNQAIQKILEQYRTYKPKIDELDNQKQVFLQTLIKMAPV